MSQQKKFTTYLDVGESVFGHQKTPVRLLDPHFLMTILCLMSHLKFQGALKTHFIMMRLTR
eukprot:5667044-Pyramimonas_sp.AAC.1